jgi:hypothetical protein
MKNCSPPFPGTGILKNIRPLRHLSETTLLQMQACTLIKLKALWSYRMSPKIQQQKNCGLTWQVMFKDITKNDISFIEKQSMLHGKR